MARRATSHHSHPDRRSVGARGTACERKSAGRGRSYGHAASLWVGVPDGSLFRIRAPRVYRG
jgi:hypothetical protein